MRRASNKFTRLVIIAAASLAMSGCSQWYDASPRIEPAYAHARDLYQPGIVDNNVPPPSTEPTTETAGADHGDVYALTGKSVDDGPPYDAGAAYDADGTSTELYAFPGPIDPYRSDPFFRDIYGGSNLYDGFGYGLYGAYGGYGYGGYPHFYRYDRDRRDHEDADRRVPIYRREQLDDFHDGRSDGRYDPRYGGRNGYFARPDPGRINGGVDRVDGRRAEDRTPRQPRPVDPPPVRADSRDRDPPRRPVRDARQTNEPARSARSDADARSNDRPDRPVRDARQTNDRPSDDRPNDRQSNDRPSNDRPSNDRPVRDAGQTNGRGSDSPRQEAPSGSSGARRR